MLYRLTKLDISSVSGNKSVPAALVAAAEAEEDAEVKDPGLLWWLRCPFGGIVGLSRWSVAALHPRDQVCATTEAACNRAMPVRRTNV